MKLRIMLILQLLVISPMVNSASKDVHRLNSGIIFRSRGQVTLVTGYFKTLLIQPLPKVELSKEHKIRCPIMSLAKEAAKYGNAVSNCQVGITRQQVRLMYDLVQGFQDRAQTFMNIIENILPNHMAITKTKSKRFSYFHF
jgi:hypothetical protein